MLRTLVRATAKLSIDHDRACSEVLARIQDELAETLGDKDRLSILFGMISRHDLSLRMMHLGTLGVDHQAKGQAWRQIPAAGPALTRAQPWKSELGRADERVILEPSDRLLLLSDGFRQSDLSKSVETDSNALLNDLAFGIKSHLASPDDLPEQDCTALCLTVSPRALRLASR